MIEALANVSRKKADLTRVKIWGDQVQAGVREQEKTATEALENIVAFTLDGNHATLTALARELHCSRDKVKGMAERARRRNGELLRKGTN